MPLVHPHTVYHYLTLILDILFPPSEEALLVRALTRDDVLCLYEKRLHDNTISLSHYRDPRIRALLHEAKFHGNVHAHTLLAALVERFLSEYPAHNTILVVPIPLSRARFHTRGYNQVQEIVKYAEQRVAHATLAPTLLIRTRDTRPQTELNKEKRLKNVQHAFSVPDPRAVRGATILLVDDVYTTGATMRAAKAALLPHSPAHLITLSLAH